MSLQYIKKEIRNELNFLHADKYQNFPQVNLQSDTIIIIEHDYTFSEYSK